MKKNAYRLLQGEEFGWGIDRNQPLSFLFDNKVIEGFRGDTVASALLANGVYLVGRSFKYHRPRGIMTAGVEEPNGLVTVRNGAREEVNARATMAELVSGMNVASQNRYPSLKWDLLAVNSSILAKVFPAGFYYKTFKFPRRFWESLYEPLIRRAAGLGKAKNRPDPDTYAQRHTHVDYLIVGGGLAGLLTALNLAVKCQGTGKKIMLADEDGIFGGYLHRSSASFDGYAPMPYVAQLLKQLSNYKNVTLLNRTTITALYDGQFLTGVERVLDHLPYRSMNHLPRQRFWKIRAKQIILATGSLERPLLFPDNDRPGVMMAGSLAEYITRYGVLPANHVVFITNNDSVYETAKMVLKTGRQATVIDVRPKLTDEEKTEGVMPRLALMGKVKAMGGRVIENATIESLTKQKGGMKKVVKVAINNLVAVPDGVKNKELAGNGMGLMADRSLEAWSVPCDLVAMSGGYIPTVHLYSQGRGKLRFDEKWQAFLPDSIPQDVWAVGGVNGTGSLAAIEESLLKLFMNLGLLKKNEKLPAGFPKIIEKPCDPYPCPLFILPAKRRLGRGKAKHFADFQNDVTVADWQLALREGYRSPELLKRYTTTGMATDQGKTSNLNALHFLSHRLGKPLPEVGITTFRPPYSTQSFGAIAGHQVGELFQQKRGTAMHGEHQKLNAVFEPVGDWLRAWYYPQGNETMEQAVHRECLATRRSVGLLDASTLGKIDIQGKDALKLLNLVYSNRWDNLDIGKCRYGLMLNENGMIFDDGVTARLGEHHYHMTTTTGGAARVINWLEEWLQTEYPSWQVYATSATEQWAVMAIAGPMARHLLSELTDASVEDNDFPHMAWRDMTVMGIKGRVFRISFTGELSYEINVPARYGATLWQGLLHYGHKYGITPYGTETMHVLRAEKGYIIVGQDTDGMATPDDVGLSGMVAESKDFLGKRSLYRPDTIRPDRRHLVGLLPLNSDKPIKEGSQVVAQLKFRPPMDMVGYVTSSYYSAFLGHPFALGLIKNGRNLMGQILWVPVMGKGAVKVKVVEPFFVDKENRRLLS